MDSKYSQEWAKQAQYDFETAQAMLKAGRHIYCVFMCHLAIEKALKGVVYKVSQQPPPKIHSLIQLSKKAQLVIPEEIGKFLVNLDQASIATRYPEEIDEIRAVYTKEKVEEILLKTGEALQWAKKMY